jgi:hypothetical protein
MDENQIMTGMESADPWDSIDITDIMPTEDGADQPAAEEGQVETEDTAEAQTETETTEVVEEAPAPEMYELKHLDEVKSVNRDEVVALAQKGLDYDRKFAKYEELKQFRDTNREAIEMLSDMAGKENIPVAQMLKELRLRQLMNDGLSEQAARQQMSLDERERTLRRKEAERERQEVAEKEKQEAQAEAKRKADEGRKADITRFMRTFPGTDPDSIPKEVWAKVQSGEMGLTEAYAIYDRQRLANELEAEKQNSKNRQLSTGSRGSAGQSSQMDEFARLWYED